MPFQKWSNWQINTGAASLGAWEHKQTPGRVHVDPAKIDPARLAVAERLAGLIESGAPDGEIEALIAEL